MDHTEERVPAKPDGLALDEILHQDSGVPNRPQHVLYLLLGGRPERARSTFAVFLQRGQVKSNVDVRQRRRETRPVGAERLEFDVFGVRADCLSDSLLDGVSKGQFFRGKCDPIAESLELII